MSKHKKYSQEWQDEILIYDGVCSNPWTENHLEERKFKPNFKIINIVGTNGKGSVSKYINDALIAQGYKVGMFTSPHLIKYNERIRINNREITDDEMFDILNPYFDTYIKNRTNFFSLLFIASMIHFQNNDVDYVVLEAGIGAKDDPTNIYDGQWGGVTSISDDHINMWFKTRENIPKDKSFIINKDMHFFLPSTIDSEDQKYFIERNNKVGGKIFFVDNKGNDYRTRNQLLAKAMIKDITNTNYDNFQEPVGRFTIKKMNGKNLILDVGHNYDAFVETLKLIKKENINFSQVLISLSGTKDDSKIESLFPNKKIFIYQHRGIKPKLINDYLIRGQVINDISKFAREIKDDTLIIGSFFPIGEVLTNIN